MERFLRPISFEIPEPISSFCSVVGTLLFSKSTFRFSTLSPRRLQASRKLGTLRLKFYLENSTLSELMFDFCVPAAKKEVKLSVI
jgi:hypothetical protein